MEPCMKIVALTDIHGAYELAEAIIRAENPDVVILGGDLTTVGSVREAEGAIHLFARSCPRIYAVAGNMDLPSHDDFHVKSGISLNGRGVVLEDVGFFGVSGGPVSPLRTPYELEEEEIGRRAMAGHDMVRQCARRIFVPHAPPFGTKVDIIHSGIHVGSHAVREFIEDYQPDVVICGHIHEARGQDTIGATKIVNCGPGLKGCYAVLEFPDQRVSIETRIRPV